MKTAIKPAPTAKVRLTTAADVARIQSKVAVNNGGGVPKGSRVGRMQRAVAQRDAASISEAAKK